MIKKILLLIFIFEISIAYYTPQDVKRVGELFYLKESGQLFSGEIKNKETIVPYINGKRHGIIKKYRKDGSLVIEIPFIDGYAEGEVKIYNKDGNLTITQEVSQNKKHGITKYYEKNSETHEIYVENVLKQVQLFKKSIKIADIEFTNNNNFTMHQFYETGKVLALMIVEDNIYSAVIYYDNGTVYSEMKSHVDEPMTNVVIKSEKGDKLLMLNYNIKQQPVNGKCLNSENNYLTKEQLASWTAGQSVFCNKVEVKNLITTVINNIENISYYK